MNEPLVVLAALLLLPIIPAFLLFKALPSSATVDGPLAGLTVKLGGAFGGYVALTVFMALFFAEKIQEPKATYREWEISGPVVVDGDSGMAMVRARAVPPIMQVESGTFFMRTWMPDDRRPNLVFEARDYETQNINLAQYEQEKKVDIDKDRGVIVFKQPIVLKKSARPYVAASAAAAIPVPEGGS
jgi:hypothetical protein